MSEIIKLNIVGRESTIWIENRKLAAAIQRVRDLHVPEQTVWGVEGTRCEECGWILPCRTLLELDGEQA